MLNKLMVVKNMVHYFWHWESDKILRTNPEEMKADVKNLSDRPSDVFLISALQFPHIWEMIAKQNIHHTKTWMLKGGTHVAQNTYEGRIHHGKCPQRRKVGDSPPLSERSVTASNEDTTGSSASDVECTSGPVSLTTENSEFFKENAFWSWNFATNQNKTSSWVSTKDSSGRWRHCMLKESLSAL